jgi:glycerol-3-phosphate dehydrogenase
MEQARSFINNEMGQEARMQSVSNVPLNLTKEEMQTAKERFNQLDRDRKGHITVNDIRRHFREHGNKIDERLLHDLLNEVDLNKNGELELAEFFQASFTIPGAGMHLLILLHFQLYSGLKTGQITQNRLVRYLDEMSLKDLARSGGGF